MANYWEDSAWIVKAVQAELSVRPLLTRRRWTDKDIIAANAVYWPEWPIIPEGEKFAGGRALRVFFKVEDFSKPEADPTRIVMKPPGDAILVSTISVEDARRAEIVVEDNSDAPLIPCLVVPAKFFVWVAGALSFDKKVLLTLSRHVLERCLDHKDADIWPEIVWITPMKADDRKHYYAVLPLVGMGGVIDPQKGNPGIYAPLQANDYHHIVWDVIDEVMDGGTSAWGTGAASGDGAAVIFAIKLRLVNFLRDKADAFVVEEFRRMIEDGGFDRGAVFKAISKGFGRHKPDRGKTLREHWLKRADEVGKPRIARATLAGRIYGFGVATSTILKGFGEGWAADLQVEADRLVALALNCTRHNYFAKAAKIEGLNKPSSGSDLAELAEEGYIKGELLLEDVEEIDKSHELNLPSAEREKDLHDEWLRDMEDQLQYILGPRFPH